jgi:hypothetical protein
MTQDARTRSELLADRQKAKLFIRAGRHKRAAASINVSTGGLLAAGTLVSSILLSTAILVGVAGRAGRKRADRSDGPT